MRLLKALSVALLAAGLGAVLVPGVVIADGGSVANHVVISEVELDDSEWVELYNPTDSDVNIDEWYWCYYSSGSDWNDPDNHKALEGSISAESFFLLRIDGPVASPDWNTGYSSNPNTLNDSDGSVGIFTSDPADAEDVTNAKDLKKDVVAWGSVNHVKETAEASAPGAGESLQRKISDTQDEDSYGPAWDTDDNSNDFFIQDSPNPQNSDSEPMAPVPDLPAIILFSLGLLALGGYIWFGKRRELATCDS